MYVYDGKKKKKPTHLNQVESEILCYNSEDCIHIDEDPLLWWKKRESQYPLMVKLVRKYFSIPATSVRSEDLLHCRERFNRETKQATPRKC